MMTLARVTSIWRAPALILHAMMLVAGCGGGGSSQGGAPPVVTAPAITTQPGNVTVSVGSVATFSVVATGSPPLSYQWQLSENGGATWSSAPGTATSASYSTPAAVIGYDGYNYRVHVSNQAGTVTSGIALLTVQPASPPPSIERLVYATATDPGITSIPGTGEVPHLAINPSASVNPQGKLLVFLPGTQSRPTQYSLILRAASSRGFHAVGVNYANQTAMAVLCQNSVDVDCYWTARNEIIFGGGNPVSGQAAVTEADSIVNRLNKALVWLNANYATEGWGQFLLDTDTVDWSKVVLAGHSQGGGHVGVLAKTVSLARAVYFSSPDDWIASTDTPANWTATKPDVTPASQQYGFSSDRDMVVPNAHAFAHWDNLGLYKPASGPVLVDSSAAPFSFSHQLHTSLPYNPASTAAPGLSNHGITVMDVSTPVDGDGEPLFDTNGVWAYLCFE